MMVEAGRLQSESELPYLRKIRGLKMDNRSLRRLCEVPLGEDSDDEAEKVGKVVGQKGLGEGVRWDEEKPTVLGTQEGSGGLL